MSEPVRFEIIPQIPFRVSASAEFFASFVPATGTAASDGDGLVMVCLADGSFEPIGVRLCQRGDAVEGTVYGRAGAGVVRAQVARMLSLDVDASGWLALGERDPVVGSLQARYPGFLPVCFPSPYEAAFWGILAQRVPMRRAAVIKKQLAERYGERVDIGGRARATVPRPETVLALPDIEGLSEEKQARLKGIARAAADGELDAERLRAMSVDAALEALATLRGVGAWTAAHILYRGAALPDALAIGEPRVLRAVSDAYGAAAPTTEAQFERLAESWRPYRMWVAILLARSIAGTPAWRDRPGDRRGRKPRKPGPAS